MLDPDNAIRKLRRPPAAHNWVKNLRRRTDDMALSLYNTAVNGPRHSLKAVTDIITAVVVDGIDEAQANKCASRITNARTKAYSYQVLKVILPYIKEKGWKGVQVFKGIEERYPVAANVSVPVRPTFVLNDGVRAIPYFVICWAAVGLSDYQKRILTTLISEAILSQEDFDGSDAIIVCVPRHSFSKTERYVVEWKVSDYSCLSEEEKGDLFERYGNALAEAERMILEGI